MRADSFFGWRYQKRGFSHRSPWQGELPEDTM
jgi:hypothetical protein